MELVKKKEGGSVKILIHPPSQYFNNWYQSGYLQDNLTIGRKILDRHRSIGKFLFKYDSDI